MIFAEILALAVAAGLLGSMLGVGGGIVMVPALTLALGLPIKTAIATSMVCVIATSAVGQIAFVKRGLTNARLGFFLEVGSAAGAIAGGLIAVAANARALQVCFAAVLVYVVWQTRRHVEAGVPEQIGELGATFVDLREGREVLYGVRRSKLGLALSAGAGVVAGMLGVGGGAFKVPTMTLVMGVPLRAAIATSNLMIGVTAATGAVIFYGRGFVVPEYAVPAALGILVGARVGAQLAAHLSTRVLSTFFQVVLCLFAVIMIVEAVVGL